MSWSLGVQEELADYINGTNPNVQFTSIQMLAILEEVRATCHVAHVLCKKSVASICKSERNLRASCSLPVVIIRRKHTHPSTGWLAHRMAACHSSGLFQFYRLLTSLKPGVPVMAIRGP